jgi:hypothetical protein
VLRKVERIGEKKKEDEIWQIELLGNKIELDKVYINSILLCEIDTKNDKLTISQEVDGVLNTVKSKKYIIKNI